MNKATVPARPYLFLPHHCHWLAPFLPFEALLDLPFNFFQMFHFLSSCRSLPQAVLCPLSSVQSLSRVWLFATPWTAARQASLSITNYQTLLNSCPSSQWCHPTISSTVVPFSFHLQSFPTSGSFLVSQFFQSGDKVLEFQLQHQSFQWIFRSDLL